MNRRPTFDAGPLLRQAVLVLNLGGEHDHRDGSVTSARVAELLGASDRQVKRWRAGARMYEETADRCAVALGLHPALLWPEWFAVDEDPDGPVRVGRRRGFMRWRGKSIEVRVYAGQRLVKTSTARWRGSSEATEAVAEVLLERLLMQLDDDRLTAAG